MKSLFQLYIEQEKLNTSIIRLTEAIQRLSEQRDDDNIKRTINRMKSRRESAYILLKIVRRDILTRRTC